ncbi:Uma2 family endonuclease [Spirillospora albida]|uniref:Uma2 family endonuclease n=1 Tax=Spirillospora albida TaxID=58123 RepID=UPI000AC5F868|nr:Uma2 family endonuclease [Spirillospora albida]
MTVMAHEPLTQDGATVDLVEYFLALDTPEGFRAELIDGEIVVTPPPGGDHEACIAVITLQIVRHSPTMFHNAPNKGLLVPSGGRCPSNRVIPDATFAPAELRLFHGADPWMPPDGVSMVVEVTSSKPDRDRETKRHCYARAGIPLYLLVDRSEDRVTLYSEPEGDDYPHVEVVPFGKALSLPEPFSVELDTSEFP